MSRRHTPWLLPFVCTVVLFTVSLVSCSDAAAPKVEPYTCVIDSKFRDLDEFPLDRAATLSILRSLGPDKHVMLTTTQICAPEVLQVLKSSERLALSVSKLQYDDARIQSCLLEVSEQLCSLSFYRHTNPSPETIRSLSELSNLEHLGLNYNGVRDEALTNVGKLEKLKILALNKTLVTDAGVRHIAMVPGLRSLHLDGTRITDEGARGLAEIRTLDQLQLSRTAIGDDGMAHLSRLPRLEDLDIGSTRVRAGAVSSLKTMTTLRRLVSNSVYIQEEELQKALPDCDVQSYRETRESPSISSARAAADK